jgi:membrane protein
MIWLRTRISALTRIRQKAEVWWDIVRRVWQQSAEDNVPFLAGGLAFNILLALVPFVLLLIGGLSFLLGNQPAEAVDTVTSLVGQLLPNGSHAADALLRGVIGDVLETRGAVTLYSAIGFAWFSTRLFGSLRSVLALTFDGSDRSIVAGKLFDLLATVVATLGVVIYVVFSAYLDLATTRGLSLLREVGLRESAMGGLTYLFGRALAVSLVFALFSALYRGLPRSRPPVRVAFVGGATAAVLFEIARHLFAVLVRNADPSSLYTGTIAAIVAIVFWTYYAAFLFLIGGEVAQAYDLRKRELSLLEEPPLHPTVNRIPGGTSAQAPKAQTGSSVKPKPRS